MIPLTGTVTSEMLLAELGLAAGAAIDDLGTLAPAQRLANQSTGVWGLDNMRGAGLLKASGLNPNLYLGMGSPTAAGSYRIVIEPTTVYGSNSTSVFAADVGQFPSGSSIVLDVWGRADGAGGNPSFNSGRGGGAIKADYPTQTLVVNYKPGSFLRGGGGAGGQGGGGGGGGQGGPGLVQEGPTYSTAAPAYQVSFFVDGGDYVFVWAGSSVGSTPDGSPLTVGNTTYYRDSFQGNTGVDNSAKGGSNTITQHYAIRRMVPGGAGGLGGPPTAGALGGRGQGYDGPAAAGSPAISGTPGQFFGDSRGTGGQAGFGGAGGAGGAFGSSGATGQNGGDGTPGGAGGGGPGGAGGAHSNGAAGGPPGYYIFKGAAPVTINNQGGTVAGALG